jgi:hypothetical protein
LPLTHTPHTTHRTDIEIPGTEILGRIFIEIPGTEILGRIFNETDRRVPAKNRFVIEHAKKIGSVPS